MYPLWCLHIPPWVHVPPFENHGSKYKPQGGADLLPFEKLTWILLFCVLFVLLGSTRSFQVVLQSFHVSVPDCLVLLAQGRFSVPADRAFESEINCNNPLGTGGRLAIGFAVLLRALWKGTHHAFQPSKLKVHEPAPTHSSRKVDETTHVFKGNKKEDPEGDFCFQLLWRGDIENILHTEQ